LPATSLKKIAKGESVMQHFKLATMIILGFWLYNILFPQEAYAYLDPGSVSYAFQLLAIALVTGVVFVRVFWNKIRCFFMDLFSKKK
jgi:hypothetical protein